MCAIRAPFALVAGMLFSVALFFGLDQLVGVAFEGEPLVEAQKIEFTPKIIETPIETTREHKVTRDPPTPIPDEPRIGIDDFGADDAQPLRFERPTLPRRDAETDVGVRGMDGDPLPRVRVNPEYPVRAASAGIEGWVRVRFTVTEIGTVRDAVVVASEPRSVFDDAALKAIARWRYNPRVENGRAVERVGLETIVRFELEN